MDIRFDYELSDMSAHLDRTADLATAEEMALRYDHFCGDLIVEIDGVDLSARWRWVTVLDAADALTYVVDRLGTDAGDSDSFVFTESTAQLKFNRHGDTVEVSASYADGVATVPYATLVGETHLFLAVVISELAAEFPGLIINPYVVRLRERIAGWLETDDDHQA